MPDPQSNSETNDVANGACREHFIQVRRAELVRCLVSLVSPDQRNRFEQLARLLAATFHYQFHLRLEQLKDAYAGLDPDQDDLPTPDPQPTESADFFFSQTVELLERANFVRLDQEHIEQAVEAASDWGVNLEVDFNNFERLEVFARGDTTRTRSRRLISNWYREEQVEISVYERLVVVFRLRPTRSIDRRADPNRVYLKLFKNIPKMDLDMLLPGTRVKITRLDQGKIILPTLSGIVMATVKIIKGVALLATATVAGTLSFLGILGGTIGYGVKSFLGYQRTKDKYQLNMTRSLYYQNLDNNAGVLFRILDEAEEQEVREALLAWYLLWQNAPSGGWTVAELDSAAEAFLKQYFSIDVDFEVDDALAKLDRLGLCQFVDHNRCMAVPIDEALQRLDRSWDNLFDFNSEDGTRKAA